MAININPGTGVFSLVSCNHIHWLVSVLVFSIRVHGFSSALVGSLLMTLLNPAVELLIQTGQGLLIVEDCTVTKLND